MAFHEIQPHNDFLHETPADAPRDWSETYYFGCNVPEAGINCDVYVWFHPVLKLVSAGVFSWTGKRAYAQACEYYDYQHFLPWPEREGGTVRLANGLEIEIVEPLKRARVRYADAARGFALDLETRAVMAPVGRGDGHHFLQPVKTSGALTLRGTDHRIDGWFTRDRSFGVNRPEKHGQVPLSAWLTGVFGDDFAFHLTAFDAAGATGEMPEQSVRFGYVWRDGAVRQIVKAQRRNLSTDGVAPDGFQVRIEDDGGAVLDLRGEVLGRMPWETWPNLLNFMCLTKWSCDGRTGYGDSQVFRYNDHFHPKSAA